MAEEESNWLQTVRISLGIANVIFFLAGGALLGLGVWIFLEADDYFDAVEEGSPYGPALLSMVTGAMVILVSLFGCCGAFTKSRCLLLVFTGLVLFILFSQVILIALSFHFKDKAVENTTEELKSAITKYNSISALSHALDRIHKDFKCCGYNNTGDWIGTFWYMTVNKNGNSNAMQLFPTSCCKQNTTGCNLVATNAHTKQCIQEVKHWVEDKLIIASSVAIALIVLMVFALVIGVALLRMTPKKDLQST